MKISHHVFIICTASLLFLPVLIFGASGVDIPTQSLWVRYFTQQLYQGDLYPRWLMDVNAGFGSPVFFFYPPLAYYLAAPFKFLQSYGDFNYFQIAASCFIADILAGYAFYAWMKRENAGDQGALAGSLLYMSAPISICANFYEFILYGSLWAYVFIPLVMMYARLLAKGNVRALPWYALTLAAVEFCNVPNTLIVCLMVAIVVLMGLRRENYKRLILHFAVGSLLAAGLCAVYLLPAYTLQDFANINLHWTKFFHWTEYGAERTKLLWFYYILMATLLLACYRPSKHAEKTPLVLGILGLLLLAPFGDWVWTNLIFFIYIQMSIRFFLIPALCVAWAIAITFPFLRKTTYVLVALSVAMAYLTDYDTYYSEKDFASWDSGQYKMYHLNIDTYPDFLPGKDALTFFTLRDHLDAWEHDNPEFKLSYGNAQIKILEWLPRKILLHYSASQPSYVLLRRLFFPGVRAYDDTGNEIELLRENGAGNIAFTLAPGEHDVRIELLRLIPERIGIAISFFSLCGVLLLMLFQRKRLQPSV